MVSLPSKFVLGEYWSCERDEHSSGKSCDKCTPPSGKLKKEPKLGVNLKSALEVGLTKYFFIFLRTSRIQSQLNERSILSIFKHRLAPVAAENKFLGQKWVP
jgi:hypothetical protein